MIRRILGCAVVVGVVLMTTGSLSAHHSLAGVYDMKAEKEVTGTLTIIKFVNPHGSMHVEVKNPDGTSTEWVFTTVTYPASSSLRRCTDRLPAVMSRISWRRGKVSLSPSRRADSATTTRSRAWAWMTGSSSPTSEPPAGLALGQLPDEDHRDPGAERQDQRVPARAGVVTTSRYAPVSPVGGR